MSNTPSVIIIGAGAAGISAATKLYQNGITNITILEAENRIGGRIYSVKFEDAYIDLGAQWCHGEKNNAIYNIVKDLNILKNDEFETKLYHSELQQLNEEFTDKFFGIYGYMNTNNKTSNQVCFGKFLVESYNKLIEETWKNEPDKLIVARECLDLLERWIMAFNGAFSLRHITADSDFEECEGEHRLGWNGHGFKTLLEILMHNFPKDKIQLSKEVSTIMWKNCPLPTVNCTDGSSYTADHIIITTSLGVLKERYITFFKPQLPSDKITAIKTLGMDSVCKVFFHFPNKWWDKKLERINFVWSSHDLLKSVKEFPDGPHKNGRSWITSIAALHITTKNPNVLTAWFSGEMVPDIEQMSNEILIKGVTYILKRFLEHEYSNLSSPDYVIRENWYTNPHFRGTYSFQTVESQAIGTSQEVVLSEPLLANNGKPSILFAGEATHPVYFSTVHGAVESGFREADRLISLYK